MKAVGRACDCTVNDVLMAAAAGALREYMRERGETLEGMTPCARPCRSTCARWTREEARQPFRPGVPRPAGGRSASPVRRLERVADCMRQLKHSRQAIVAFGLLAALGMAPAPVQELALDLFSRKATAVATNVPARSSRCTWPGAAARPDVLGAADRLHRHRRVDPQLRRRSAFRPDRRRAPDPGSAGRDPPLRREFDKLLYLALMADWDGMLDAETATALLEAGWNPACRPPAEYRTPPSPHAYAGLCFDCRPNHAPDASGSFQETP